MLLSLYTFHFFTTLLRVYLSLYEREFDQANHEAASIRTNTTSKIKSLEQFREGTIKTKLNKKFYNLIKDFILTFSCRIRKGK